MIKAVLFDMDGVLYDSMASHVQAWRETMLSVGLECPLEDFYLMEGQTGRGTIEFFFKQMGKSIAPEEIKKIYSQKTKRFMELEHAGSKPMQGASDVLKKVKALGLMRLIVTGSGQHSLIDKVNSHFPGFFEKELMVTAYDVKHGKPHPEPYLMGLKKGNLLPHEAVVIENAPLGIESARAAGIYTIAVNTGPLPDKVLRDAGANTLFPSMTALSENIESIICNLTLNTESFSV
jgi:HAD superfamily hydrolase (TIGR01509 family)